MLSAILNPSDIIIRLDSTEKEEAFAELLEVMVAKNPGINRNEAMSVLINRENKMSTAIFPSIAVPHGVCSSIKKTAVAIGISHKGIEFEPVESDKNSTNPIVNIIFEILFEQECTGTHLHVLRDILQLVSQPEFVTKILQTSTAQEAYDFITSLEL